MRKLYHFTPRKNAGNITTLGLQVRYSQTSVPAIWLCGYRMLSWTLAHIRAKYQCDRESLVCYQAVLPSNWLFKIHRGLWICYQDIPISRLTMVTT